MKKLLTLSAALVFSAALATPALAGHGGSRRGHGPRVVRGAYLGLRAAPVPHIRAPRIFTSFSVNVGYPPVYAAPVYYPPRPVYYYAPAPVVVVTHPAAIWVPGHYAYRNGCRFHVEGHWTYR